MRVKTKTNLRKQTKKSKRRKAIHKTRALLTKKM